MDDVTQKSVKRKSLEKTSHVVAWPNSSFVFQMFLKGKEEKNGNAFARVKNATNAQLNLKQHSITSIILSVPG